MRAIRAAPLTGRVPVGAWWRRQVDPFAGHLFGVKELDQTPAYECTQDAFAGSGLQLVNCRIVQAADRGDP